LHKFADSGVTLSNSSTITISIDFAVIVVVIIFNAYRSVIFLVFPFFRDDFFFFLLPNFRRPFRVRTFCFDFSGIRFTDTCGRGS